MTLSDIVRIILCRSYASLFRIILVDMPTGSTPYVKVNKAIVGHENDMFETSVSNTIRYYDRKERQTA